VIEPISHQRVMLLVTCRPEFQNQWGSHSHVTTLTLNRLGHRQCADLIGQVACGRVLPETIIRGIIDRADGVPLFVEELTKSVLESGLRRDAQGQLVVDGALAPLAIPTTLQGSLLARLDRLSTTREVVQVGAAIGREFDYNLLAAVARLPQAQLQAALSQLEAAGLVFRRGRPPEAVYTFKHALVQDAAHDSLLRSRRQQLHARIAEAIDQHYPEVASAQPQLLAQHYAEAGFAERSAKAWLQAGRLAAARSASQEAALRFARGIDVLQGAEPGRERDRLELDLQIGRGSACTVAYGFSAVETEKAWVRAIALLRDHPNDPRNFWARRGLSAVYSCRANMIRYAAIAEETMERARQSGDPAGLCVAHMIFANLYNYTGRVAAAAGSVAEAAAQYYRTDAHHGSFQLSGLDLGIHIPMARMQALSFSGNHAEADRDMNEALQLAEAQTQVGVRCWAYYWTSFRCLIDRDFARGGDLANRGSSLAIEHGIKLWATITQLSQGAALVMADPSRAVDLIRTALVRAEAIPWPQFHPIYLCFKAEALLALGRVVEARADVARALAMAVSPGLTWWDAELHRIRASVIRAEGGGDAAVREARSRAIAIATEQGSETFRRRAAAEMGVA
jgi:hypothetical protein